ncbi:alpha/beta hydrolase [Myceligenerans crystallogenes]|uniref:Serine aminopeptidase S33 domain-containing protein n=1 Tax=Myceligenerans crystallogenes TaxID=316335 RepID=A0ABN2NH38_9MICO
MTALPGARRVGETIANRMFSPPRRGHHRRPAEFGLDAAEATCTTPDGVDLHLWVIEPPSGGPGDTDGPGGPAGTAIVGHGIGLTKSASLRQAALLHEAGYGVVLYDHRNHGLSGHDAVRPGMADRFTLDIRAAADFAAARFGDERPVLAYGFSFSSFPSVYALRVESRIGAVVCDSGPASDIPGIVTRFAQAGALPLPRWILANPWGRQVVAACAARATALLAGEWPPPASQGALDRTPMLFVVGAGDAIMAADEVRAMAARYARARCVVLPGGHLESVKHDPEAYRATLTEFLEEFREEPR